MNCAMVFPFKVIENVTSTFGGKTKKKQKKNAELPGHQRTPKKSLEIKKVDDGSKRGAHTERDNVNPVVGG